MRRPFLPPMFREASEQLQYHHLSKCPSSKMGESCTTQMALRILHKPNQTVGAQASLRPSFPLAPVALPYSPHQARPACTPLSKPRATQGFAIERASSLTTCTNLELAESLTSLVCSSPSTAPAHRLLDSELLASQLTSSLAPTLSLGLLLSFISTDVDFSSVHAKPTKCFFKTSSQTLGLPSCLRSPLFPVGLSGWPSWKTNARRASLSSLFLARRDTAECLKLWLVSPSVF